MLCCSIICDIVQDFLTITGVQYSLFHSQSDILLHTSQVNNKTIFKLVPVYCIFTNAHVHHRSSTLALHRLQGISSLKYNVLCIKPAFTVYMYICVQKYFLIYHIISFFTSKYNCNVINHFSMCGSGSGARKAFLTHSSFQNEYRRLGNFH